MNNIKIVIPARRNSKGLPFKNRTLIKKTLNTIPDEYKSNILVSTDDEYIIQICKDNSINYHVRSTTISADTTSTKEVMEALVKEGFLKSEEVIIMLYTTYPERKWDDVLKFYNFFISNNCNSLLTKYDINSSHPFLMAFEDGHKGKQIYKHNLFRRQDYPKVFEISHYICIFKVKELKNLNNNLYNDDTFFYRLEKKIDVDTKEDLERYEKTNTNNS